MADAGLLRRGPEAGSASAFHVCRHRVGADKVRGGGQKLEKLVEILAEDEQAGLADILRLVVAPALGEHHEVVAVVRTLHLRHIGPRADRLEELLKQDLVVRRLLLPGGFLRRAWWRVRAPGV